MLLLSLGVTLNYPAIKLFGHLGKFAFLRVELIWIQIVVFGYLGRFCSGLGSQKVVGLGYWWLKIEWTFRILAWINGLRCLRVCNHKWVVLRCDFYHGLAWTLV
jgi:hypothetical protein